MLPNETVPDVVHSRQLLRVRRQPDFANYVKSTFLADWPAVNLAFNEELLSRNVNNTPPCREPPLPVHQNQDAWREATDHRHKSAKVLPVKFGDIDPATKASWPLLAESIDKIAQKNPNHILPILVDAKLHVDLTRVRET